MCQRFMVKVLKSYGHFPSKRLRCLRLAGFSLVFYLPKGLSHFAIGLKPPFDPFGGFKRVEWRLQTT